LTRSICYQLCSSPARNPNELKASVKILSQLDAIWREQDAFFLGLEDAQLMPTEYDLENLEAMAGSTDSESFKSAAQKPLPIGVWRYFGADDGSFRIIPGIEVADNFDPTMRPWYKLAMTNPDQTLITPPYIDAFGMGYVVTICRAVRYAEGSDSVYGVLATDYFLSQIGTLFIDNLDMCKWTSDREYPACMMVDSTGAVIYWEEFLANWGEFIEFPHQDVHGETHWAPNFLDQFYISPGLNTAYGDSIADGLSGGHKHECFNMVDKHSVNFINLDESMLLKEMLHEQSPCAALGSADSGQTRICKLFNFNAYIIQTDDLGGFWPTMESSQVYSGTQANYDFCKNTMGELFTNAEQNDVPVCQKVNPNVDTHIMLGSFISPTQDVLNSDSSNWWAAPGFQRENQKYNLQYDNFDDISVRVGDQCYAYMKIINDVSLYEDKPLTYVSPPQPWSPWELVYYIGMLWVVKCICGGKKQSSSSS